MQSRSFTALTMVTMPRIDAASACALGFECLAVVEDVKLHAGGTEALDEVRQTHASLVDAISADSLDAGMAEAPVAKAADAKVDNAWGAFYSFCTSWSRLGDSAEADHANAILNAVFPDGTAFLKLAYRQEFVQSFIRLKMIDEKELSSNVDALGGTKLLKLVREAHKEYGEALGITSPAEVTDLQLGVRDALFAFFDALRFYVVQLAAMQRKSDPKGTALSFKLLQPISDVQASTYTPKAPATGATQTPGDANAPAAAQTPAAQPEATPPAVTMTQAKGGPA